MCIPVLIRLCSDVRAPAVAIEVEMDGSSVQDKVFDYLLSKSFIDLLNRLLGSLAN